MTTLTWESVYVYLTDWQSGRQPDSVWLALKDLPIIFWNCEVCQGPQIGKLPCWGMYQGTHSTLLKAFKGLCLGIMSI